MISKYFKAVIPDFCCYSHSQGINACDDIDSVMVGRNTFDSQERQFFRKICLATNSSLIATMAIEYLVQKKCESLCLCMGATVGYSFTVTPLQYTDALPLVWGATYHPTAPQLLIDTAKITFSRGKSNAINNNLVAVSKRVGKEIDRATLPEFQTLSKWIKHAQKLLSFSTPHRYLPFHIYTAISRTPKVQINPSWNEQGPGVTFIWRENYVASFFWETQQIDNHPIQMIRPDPRNPLQVKFRNFEITNDDRVVAILNGPMSCDTPMGTQNYGWSILLLSAIHVDSNQSFNSLMNLANARNSWIFQKFSHAIVECS